MGKRIIPIEIFFVTHMLLFGVVLLLPRNTFDNEVYVIMSRVASENTWGVLCVALALVQAIAMFTQHRFSQIITLSITSFFYSFIGAMFIISSFQNDFVNTGVTYFTVAGLALWVIYAFGNNGKR